MQITESGENLHVIIITTTAEDWRTFGTWYSIYKNLPDAKVVISCVRNKKVEFQYYQWAKRLNVPLFYTNAQHNDTFLDRCSVLAQVKLSPQTLVVTPNIMFIDVLDEKFLALLNGEDGLYTDYDLWYVKNQTREQIQSMMDEYALGEKVPGNPIWMHKEAKETSDLVPVVSYGKGCGKWIDTMHGCPFSNASGLLAEEVTVNEKRIIELWRKMVSLYSAVL